MSYACDRGDFYITSKQYSHVRRLEYPYKDLHEVANLIEICFADQMDADGEEYLRQLRRVAQRCALSQLGRPG
jgi:hypothetical protein